MPDPQRRGKGNGTEDTQEQPRLPAIRVCAIVDQDGSICLGNRFIPLLIVVAEPNPDVDSCGIVFEELRWLEGKEPGEDQRGKPADKGVVG